MDRKGRTPGGSSGRTAATTPCRCRVRVAGFYLPVIASSAGVWETPSHLAATVPRGDGSTSVSPLQVQCRGRTTVSPLGSAFSSRISAH